VSGQLHASAALRPGRETWYPLNRRLGWELNPGRPAGGLVTLFYKNIEKSQYNENQQNEGI